MYSQASVWFSLLAQSGQTLNAHRQYSAPHVESHHSSRQQTSNIPGKNLHIVSFSSLQKPNKNARQPKLLNLKTYKFHSLGDYHNIIRQFDMTDLYLTQLVSVFQYCNWAAWYLSSTRVNRSTKFLKGVSFEWVANQYPSNYPGLNSDSATFARSMRTWMAVPPRPYWRI